MKDKKKRRIFPHSLIRSLSEDIRSLMQTSEGRLLALEILDEIPKDLRPHVISGLSSFYTREMTDFFYLVREEFGKEIDTACQRSLEKFSMAGMDVCPPEYSKMEFYKAYVTRTRHTGQVTVDVAWISDNQLLDVECFFLSSNTDGLHGFFVISEMPISEYGADRELLPDMLEIDLEETCFLVREAYSCNIKYMTRPALGRFLYRKYLDYPNQLNKERTNELIAKTTPALEPRELINTFFYALRQRDLTYLESTMTETRVARSVMMQQLNDIVSPGALLIEGQSVEARVTRNRGMVKSYCIHVVDEDVYRSDFAFYLLHEAGRWYIAGLVRDELQLVNQAGFENPFLDKINCWVYEILDPDLMFEVLEEIDDLRQVGELPFGVHLRVTRPDDDVMTGVFFFSGIMADMVVNGDELVIMAKDEDGLREIDQLLISNGGSVRPSSRHQVEIITAYEYLSGQYLSFAEMLMDENDEIFFEDGLKFLTVRYLVKDQEKVLEKMSELTHVFYKFPGDYQVFYEFAGHNPETLTAEYVVGSDWITVSAFGEKDLGHVRERFEQGIEEHLEFEGMEVKCEGIFEIITHEVKKQYPELETELKQAYLNKWYKSKLKPLRGMSPQDASKSVEGKRLLWTMFKDIKRKEKIRQDLGVRNSLDIKDYVDKLNLKKEREHK